MPHNSSYKDNKVIIYIIFMTQILVFGDSIAYGSWDKAGGWVQRLRTFIEEKYPEEHLVYNLGVSADTTDSLLERLEIEIKKRGSERNQRRGIATILIFQIGTNDSAILSTKKRFMGWSRKI